MRTLVLKDLRLLTPLIITAVTGTVLLHLMVDSAMLLSQRHEGRLLSARDMAQTWVDTCMINLVCMVPFCATIGGMAFAHERRERWAEFAAMMPVPRGTAVTVKLIVSVSVGVLMGVFQLGVLFGGYALLERWLPGTVRPDRGNVIARAVEDTLPLVACASAATFGLAWLASALLRGAVWPTVGGMGAVAAGFAVVILVFGGRGNDVHVVIEILLVLSAVAAVGIGSAIQTLRQTP